MRKYAALVTFLAWQSVGLSQSFTARPPAPQTPGVVERLDRGEHVAVLIGVRTTPPNASPAASPAAAASQAAVAAALRAAGSEPHSFRAIPFLAATIDRATYDALLARGDVASITGDPVAYPNLAESGPLVGADKARAAGYSGKGQAVAVVDTGVEKTHPFLGGRVISEACYSGGVDGGESLCPGGARESTATDSAQPCSGTDGCEHGTHVAGIAAGSGSSFSGMAPDASIVAVKVFTRKDGSLSAAWSDILKGLDRVIALRQAGTPIASANLSLGTATTYSSTCDATYPSMQAMFTSLRTAGIAPVVSAGNDGYSDSISSPACVSAAVSVGSTTKQDSISSFSNRATFLRLLAPGGCGCGCATSDDILSSILNGQFGTLAGTSMAAPHVTGAWAVLRSRKPSATVDQILEALRSTGLSIKDQASGNVYPRIRIDRALNALPSAGMRMSLDAPVSGGTISGTFLVSGWTFNEGAASGTGVDAVHVYATPSGGSAVFLGVAVYGDSRPDVAALYGAQFRDSGYHLSVAGLAAGSYQLSAYAHNALTNAFDTVRTAPITVVVPVSKPFINVDTPSASQVVTSAFEVGGWALDTGAASGTGVDAIVFYVFPNDGAAPGVYIGQGSYGSARADDGALFGSRFTNSGYHFTITGLGPGAYLLGVYGHSTVTGSFSIVKTVRFVVNATALMSIDVPSAEAPITAPTFAVSGWAIDRSVESTALAGSGVDTLHVYAYPNPGSGQAPIFIGVAAVGVGRTDVGGIYGGRYAASGYTLTVNRVSVGLTAGTYNIVVHAHSAVTNAFNNVALVRVTLQ